MWEERKYRVYLNFDCDNHGALVVNLMVKLTLIDQARGKQM